MNSAADIRYDLTDQRVDEWMIMMDQVLLSVPHPCSASTV